MKLDLSKYKFKTTEDLDSQVDIIGQNRGVNSMNFGLSIKRRGYNIYTSGEIGTGRTSHSYLLASIHAKGQKTPEDICYVYNFKEPEKPIMIMLKSGHGVEFKKYIESNIKKIREESQIILNSEEYEEKRDLIYKYFQNKTEKIIVELNDEAKKHGFIFEKMEEGLASAPLVDGRPMSDEEVDCLSDYEIELIKRNSNTLELETIDIVRKFKRIEEALEEKVLSIDSEILLELIDEYLGEDLEKFKYNMKVENYIDEIKKDILDNLEEFIVDELEEETVDILLSKNKLTDDFFKRYQVNLLIDNSGLKGAPVINEMNPSYYNLFGKIEYYNELGCLKTDHMRIKPGTLQRANGGYILIKAKELLSNAKTWNMLKKCILTEKTVIENMSKEYLIEECLDPESIPLDVKIILIGDEHVYQLLYNFDEDFKQMFKIKVDLDIEMDRNDDNIKKIISFISTYSKKEEMKSFTKCAIEEIIDYSSRIIENQNKLTTKFSEILEIMYEGDAWADILGASYVSGDHIKKAISEKIYRNNKYEEKLQDMICTGKLIIDLEDEKIGEINGLAVIDTGEYAFGKPTKITATTFLGRGGITNIEREIGGSGESHDKGVFILGGFIGEEFIRKYPLSFSARITFEQCYAMIDGDSASSTELYALLSSISELPINQGIATTGSVNQKGMIQAIGGVNEKIEGFFKICDSSGLTGKQGVIIPFQNIENLMLSKEVIEAVSKDLFHIYAVKNVKQGIEILTGVEYGKRDKRGRFESGTIGYLIDKKLSEYSKNI